MILLVFISIEVSSILVFVSELNKMIGIFVLVICNICFLVIELYEVLIFFGFNIRGIFEFFLLMRNWVDFEIIFCVVLKE